MPACNCGQSGDVESVASLTGIQNNLLPYWLTRYEGHDLGGLPIGKAAKLVRRYAEDGDEMALAIFRQQAIAIGRLFHIAANFLDPDAYFLGGGVVTARPRRTSATGSSQGARRRVAACRTGQRGRDQSGARPGHGRRPRLGRGRARLVHQQGAKRVLPSGLLSPS